MNMLEDRVIAVTGGSRGIGRAIADYAVTHGARVAIIDNRAPEGVRRESDKVIEIYGDVTSRDSLKAAAESVMGEFGAVHGLVCNAALYAGLTIGRFDGLTSHEWERVLAVNVIGTWNTITEFTPALRIGAKERSASIVTISSAAALAGEKGVVHYVASKGAVIAMTRSLARELGHENIRVNGIAPGFVMSEGSVELTGGAPEALGKRVRGERAIPHDLQPLDIAKTAMYLLSDASSMVTGQQLVVDGGAVMP